MDQRLESELRQVARRRGMVWMWRALAVAWLVLAVVTVIVMLGCWLFDGPTHVAAIGMSVAVGLVTLSTLKVSQRLAGDMRGAARGVEHRFAELDNRLLAAIEQREGWPPGQYGYLQDQVVSE